LDTTILAFSIGCAALDTATYFVYNWRAWRGEGGPQSGFLWLLSIAISIMNAGSYTLISKHWIMTVLLWENAVMVIVTFVTILYHHKAVLKKLGTSKKISAALCVLALLSYFVFREAKYANFILQAAALITIKTLWDDLRLDPTAERRLPWGMWAIVYAVQALAALVFWPGSWEKLAYPLVYAFFHAAIFIATLLPPKQLKRPPTDTPPVPP
jgi:hypothetical protein